MKTYLLKDCLVNFKQDNIIKINDSIYQSAYLPILFHSEFIVFIGIELFFPQNTLHYLIAFEPSTAMEKTKHNCYAEQIEYYIRKQHSKIKTHYLPTILNYFDKYKIKVNNIKEQLNTIFIIFVKLNY